MRPTTRFILGTSALMILTLGVFWLSRKDGSIAPGDTASSKSASAKPGRTSAKEGSQEASVTPGKQPAVPEETLKLRQTLLANVRENIKDPLLRRDHEAQIL